MQISSLLFLVAPAAIFICIVGLTLIPLIGYLQSRFLRRLLHQQCLFDEALAKREVEIIEESCQRISLELHDGVGHLLSLAKLHLNTGPSAVAEEANSLISEALELLRSISRGLNTDIVSCCGLRRSLEQEVEQIRKSRLEILLEQTGEAYFLDDQAEICLYRIAQECLSNIIKHANADHIRILLEYQPRFFCMTISDNGMGIDINLNSAPGCGLSNIRKRCRMIDAEMEIRTHKGTSVTIKIPIHDRASAGVKA